MKTALCGVGLATLTAAFAAYPLAAPQGQRSAANAPPANGYITGVVQGGGGPEAGVWVIAETKDLPTNFIKIVVTDDQGRFMLPELPAATYSVWVRGYGLVDSTPMQLKPGATAVTLRGDGREDAAGSGARSIRATTGCRCSSRRPQSEFPGTGPQGNGLGTEHADAEPLDQLAQVGLQLLSSARQPADAQRRSRLQGEAGAQDARRGVGVAARHRRARQRRCTACSTNQGKDAVAEGLRRLDRAHRQGRSAAGAAAAEGRRAQRRA